MRAPTCLLSLLLCLLIACRKEEVPVVAFTDEEIRAGGATTVYSSGPDAYTYPLANLDATQVQRHFQADLAFDQTFVTYPAAQSAGLGPLFNQTSCVSCHVRNGRSELPRTPGDPRTGFLMRISMPGAGPSGTPLPVPGFGTQLQTKAIFGEQPEGQVSISYIEEVVTFLDGSSATLMAPVYTITDTYIPLPGPVLSSFRNAPPVIGLGLLEAIPPAAILALADEHDSDGDGISGKPNSVPDMHTGEPLLGRFGWKAGSPGLIRQTAEAYHQDMGVTSDFYFPEEHCSDQANCARGIGPGADITRQTVELTAFYPQTLAVPAPRNRHLPEVAAGKTLFYKIGCVACHIPRHVTGDHEIAALSGQTIYPYTDLLLHDMGAGLADHRPEFAASGSEWRTPPLWGIGLARIVHPGAGFLHDGRARTLEEAILWHGGEAASAKERYRRLSSEERQQLIAFLNAL